MAETDEIKFAPDEYPATRFGLDMKQMRTLIGAWQEVLAKRRTLKGLVEITHAPHANGYIECHIGSMRIEFPAGDVVAIARRDVTEAEKAFVQSGGAL